MMNQLFNPDMLILARESRGYSQSELSGLISVNQATVSRIESGVLQPSQDLEVIFSKVLRYHPSLFRQSDRVYGFNSTVFFHRKRQSLADKILRKLHACMNITRMRVARLIRSETLDSPNRFQHIKANEYDGGTTAAARVVRSTWQLPAGPIRSVMQAIEDAGGIVVGMDFETRQADAISEWIPPHPPIFLVNCKAEIPGDRMRLTLAHELAHVVMHSFPTPEMEDEANAFAAEFLMPRKEIKPSLYGLTMAKLADLKRHWKVSMAALIQRAYELQTITQSQRKYLIINVAKRSGGRIHEPLESEMPLEQPQVFDRLIKTHIDTLGYAPKQVSDLMFFDNEQDFRSEYLGEQGLRLVSSKNLPA
jgi:Zn-dependent peptidase ImmA (M78 family)/transcriptional regulator with XRE-family HTH domain